MARPNPEKEMLTPILAFTRLGVCYITLAFLIATVFFLVFVFIILVIVVVPFFVVILVLLFIVIV